MTEIKDRIASMQAKIREFEELRESETRKSGEIASELKAFDEQVNAAGGVSKACEILVEPILMQDFGIVPPQKVSPYDNETGIFFKNMNDVLRSATRVFSKLSMRTRAEVLLEPQLTPSFNNLSAGYMGKKPHVVLGVQGLMMRYNIASSRVMYIDELRYIVANAGRIAAKMQELKKERAADAFLKISEVISPLKYFCSSGISSSSDWNVSQSYALGVMAPMELEREVHVSSGAAKIVGIGLSFGYNLRNPGTLSFILMTKTGRVKKVETRGSQWAAMDYAICWQALHDELNGQFSRVRDALKMAVHESMWDSKDVLAKIEDIGARWLMLQDI